MTLDAFLMEDVGNIWSWHWMKSVWKIDNVALFAFSQMTLCPITSPRARGERDLGSSSCSPSSRRQCCPADRKCTEQHRLGVKPWGVWDLFVCLYVLRRKAGRTMEICFLDGTKMKLWPMERKSTQRWWTKEPNIASYRTSAGIYKGHVRLTLFLGSVKTDCQQHLLQTLQYSRTVPWFSCWTSFF